MQAQDADIEDEAAPAFTGKLSQRIGFIGAGCVIMISSCCALDAALPLDSVFGTAFFSSDSHDAYMLLWQSHIFETSAPWHAICSLVLTRGIDRGLSR